MNIAVVYICPTENHGAHHRVYASRFAESYHKHPAGYPHQLVVVSNGGPPSRDTRSIFDHLNAGYSVHDDSGKDIGAYQFAAETVPCDLMVFCGGSTYIRGPNWLGRVEASFRRHGNGLYGVMANTGNVQCQVYPHIRTTGFWMPPALLNRYPERVKTDERRYPFEHGQYGLTQWVRSQGLPALVVTWQREYHPGQWVPIPNGFHNGDQSELIFGDRLTEPPFYPHP